MIARAADRRPGRAAILWSVVVASVLTLGIHGVVGLIRRPGTSDFPVFYDAFVAILRGASLYDSGSGGYIYPPLFATMCAPLGWLSQAQAAIMWTAANCLLALGCLWIASEEMIRRFRARDSLATAPAVMLMTLLVLLDKFQTELGRGQTDLLVLLGLLLSLRWLESRPILAGAALGFTGNLKYQSLIFLPYLLMRGRWKTLASAAASLVGFALSSSIIVGWHRNLEYLRRALGGLVTMIGADGAPDGARVARLAWLRSISLPSVFARVTNWAAWPAWATFALTALAALAALVGACGLYRRRGFAVILPRNCQRDDADPRAGALVAVEWAALIVAVLVFGPQTLARHAILTLPIVSLAVLMLITPRTGVRRLPVFIALIFFFLAFVLPPGSGGDSNEAVRAWRWIGGISIAMLALLYTTMASALQWIKSHLSRDLEVQRHAGDS